MLENFISSIPFPTPSCGIPQEAAGSQGAVGDGQPFWAWSSVMVSAPLGIRGWGLL
jgi:hypothetical protein